MFVTFNFAIHQGQNQKLNHHFLCHCLPRKAQGQEQLWLLLPSVGERNE